MSSFLVPGVVELSAKSMKKLFGMTELFYVLTEVVNSTVKTHRIVDVKYVHFIYVNYPSTQLIVLIIK